MGTVDFWIGLIVMDIVWLFVWTVERKTIPGINRRKIDPTNAADAEYKYKINSQLYKKHKKKWDTYYLIPSIVYTISYVLISVLISVFFALWFSLALYFTVLWVAGKRELPQLLFVEKEVHKMYDVEKNKLYDERYKQ